MLITAVIIMAMYGLYYFHHSNDLIQSIITSVMVSESLLGAIYIAILASVIYSRQA